MKLLHAAGGVRTTVMADVMQRAPAFGFDSARAARSFGDWVTANFAAIKSEAEATTRAGRLHDIEQFSASRFLFLRFNFTTGDAAGQNLTGKATQRACAWIRANYGGIKDFCLEANLATDKKSSHVNILPAATGPAGCASWPRSWRPLYCAARSHWARPWSRTNGSRRTSGSAGIDPRREIRQVAHRASQPLQLLLGNIITRGQRCAWVGCGGSCVCCGFWS